MDITAGDVLENVTCMLRVQLCLVKHNVFPKGCFVKTQILVHCHYLGKVYLTQQSHMREDAE